jgi:hypothetical protein
LALGRKPGVRPGQFGRCQAELLLSAEDGCLCLAQTSQLAELFGAQRGGWQQLVSTH